MTETESTIFENIVRRVVEDQTMRLERLLSQNAAMNQKAIDEILVMKSVQEDHEKRLQALEHCMDYIVDLVVKGTRPKLSRTE